MTDTYRRRVIWHHNSFYGHAGMMRAQCYSIMRARTTTPKTKEIAAQIQKLALELGDSLDTRVPLNCPQCGNDFEIGHELDCTWRMPNDWSPDKVG